MPRRARHRSETYELVFFKKTLLCHRERVKLVTLFPGRPNSFEIEQFLLSARKPVLTSASFQQAIKSDKDDKNIYLPIVSARLLKMPIFLNICSESYVISTVANNCQHVQHKIRKLIQVKYKRIQL